MGAMYDRSDPANVHSLSVIQKDGKNSYSYNSRVYSVSNICDDSVDGKDTNEVPQANKHGF